LSKIEKLDVSGDLYNLALKVLDRIVDPMASSFRGDFPKLESLPRQDLVPCLLPITECIRSIDAAAPLTIDLVDAIKVAYQKQHWRQPYSAQDFGQEFFERSAWFPIADVNGPLIYSKGLMEIMLLGPKLDYPKHRHQPEELYLVLAGKVWWEAENAIDSPCWKTAGEVIHHMPDQVHAIPSGDKPALMLNLWRGGGFEIPKIE